VEPAGIEPATSCLQSRSFLALYLGFLLIVFKMVFNSGPWKEGLRGLSHTTNLRTGPGFGKNAFLPLLPAS
jgi:hypothetical protein